MILSISIESCEGFNYHPAFTIVVNNQIILIFLVSLENNYGSFTNVALGLIYLAYNTFKHGLLILSIYECIIGSSLQIFVLTRLFFKQERNRFEAKRQILEMKESM